MKPIHEELLKRAEREGLEINLDGKKAVLRAYVYSPEKPLPLKVKDKLATGMVEVSNQAFGKAETKVAFGDNPIQGAQRFFTGNLLHYFITIERSSGEQLAYAQVAISPNRVKTAYYTSAAISPEIQGKSTYELLNVLRAAACVRHLGKKSSFHVATRTENPKVMMHYSNRGWFPQVQESHFEFTTKHRSGLRTARLNFLLGRAQPNDKIAAKKAKAAVKTIFNHGPGEAGAYSGKLIATVPDERAQALLQHVSVKDTKGNRPFSAEKGDVLYLVTSPANLHKWLISRNKFISDLMS